MKETPLIEGFFLYPKCIVLTKIVDVPCQFLLVAVETEEIEERFVISLVDSVRVGLFCNFKLVVLESKELHDLPYLGGAYLVRLYYLCSRLDLIPFKPFLFHGLHYTGEFTIIHSPFKAIVIVIVAKSFTAPEIIIAVVEPFVVTIPLPIAAIVALHLLLGNGGPSGTVDADQYMRTWLHLKPAVVHQFETLSKEPLALLAVDLNVVPAGLKLADHHRIVTGIETTAIDHHADVGLLH